MTKKEFERHLLFECNYQLIECPQKCGMPVFSERLNSEDRESKNLNRVHFYNCPFS